MCAVTAFYPPSRYILAHISWPDLATTLSRRHHLVLYSPPALYCLAGW